MNCPSCNASNPSSSRFCGQCGKGLYFIAPEKAAPESKLGKGTLMLMLFSFLQLFRSIIWRLIQKVTDAWWERSFQAGVVDYQEEMKRITMFYDVVGVFFVVVNLVVIGMGIGLSRNRFVRIFFVVLLAMELLLFVLNYLLRWIEECESLNFFNF